MTERSQVDRYGPWVASAVILIGLCMFVFAMGYSIIQNHHRIDENSKTAFALCDAAAGARHFWMGVRHATFVELKDPTLSEPERRSDILYVRALNDVIHKADGVIRFCDGRER